MSRRTRAPSECCAKRARAPHSIRTRNCNGSGSSHVRSICIANSPVLFFGTEVILAYITGEIAYTGAKLDGKKALLLCILQVLTDYSDGEHPMTSGEILRRLKEDYGIETNRNTVSRNIGVLRDLNFEISTYEENRQGAYLSAREFDNVEIRWLIDGVLNSKYLPENYAKELINKLKKLGNRHFVSGMDHVSALREWPHQNNRAISANMQFLGDAIGSCRRVRFTYNQMDCDGKLQPLEGGMRELLPLRMFCTNSQYYLVAHEFGGYNLAHFRLDRMTDMVVCGTQIEGDCELRERLDVDAAIYVREHPHMYGGKAVPVLLKMPRALAGAVFDAFGSAASMTASGGGFMHVRVKAAAEGMRFFALQFGPNCEVLEPKDLREQVVADIKNMMERYDG